MALKKAVIKVKQCDIEQGKRGKCGACPVALALFRKFGIERPKRIYSGCPRVLVGAGCATFRMVKYGPQLEGQLPRRAQNFIFKFDHDMRVKPFKFTLRYGA